eukprot:XP_001701336.1 predicted protein [Chlamydomonas reinhardtii]
MQMRCTFSNLSPELIQKIASCLHPNDVAGALKLVNSETAAALGRYNKLVLGQKLEGHAASLGAALDHHGGALTPEVLVAAAAAGSLACCGRLLCEGCSVTFEAFRAAGQAGSVPVLQLLLQHIVYSPLSRRKAVVTAARGACAGGQAAALTWLQQACGHCIDEHDAIEAAQAGQAGLLELILPLLPEHMQHYGDAEPDLRRSRLLGAIAEGCTQWAMQASRAGDGAIDPWGEGASEEEGGEEHRSRGSHTDTDTDTDTAEEILEMMSQQSRELLSRLFNGAAASPTDCWRAKLDFLRNAWGPRRTRAAVIADDTECDVVRSATCGRPDFLQRLRYLHTELGVARGRTCAQFAAVGAAADALAYVWDECGVDMAHLRVQAPSALDEDTLDDLFFGANLDYSLMPAGARLAVLQGLAERGAAVDLAAVAQGGGEEALEWAAARLEAEAGAGALAQAVSPSVARAIFADCGNGATLAWLAACGLLPPPDTWLPSLPELFFGAGTTAAGCRCTISTSGAWGRVGSAIRRAMWA